MFLPIQALVITILYVYTKDTLAYTVYDNITLTFRFYETLQERSVLRRLNGNKTNWHDIVQPFLNGRRVNI